MFDGTDLSTLKGAELRSRRRDLQLMFQDPYASLDPRMRVKEIISEPLDIAKQGTTEERENTVKRLLDEVGLAHDAMARYPHEFSGGQRQRLGLARAMALNPKVIVADEPVSALDVSIQSQILNLMKRIQARYGLTYIVISHDLSVVRYLADRIGVMYLGKLVEVGPGSDIYEKSAHPYTAGLLDAIPVPDPNLVKEKNGHVAIRGSFRRHSTRPRVAASAPAARERRTSARRCSPCCARSGRTTTPPATSRFNRRSTRTPSPPRTSRRPPARPRRRPRPRRLSPRRRRRRATRGRARRRPGSTA